jgi:hypothetical protein
MKIAEGEKGLEEDLAWKRRGYRCFGCWCTRLVPNTGASLGPRSHPTCIIASARNPIRLYLHTVTYSISRTSQCHVLSPFPSLGLRSSRPDHVHELLSHKSSAISSSVRATLRYPLIVH